ncbi:MAG: FtsH protease activity modulator HflK [Clostridia bacterium]|nr:FtsH protease activity modulator HflK [Clostridia bacterium]
MKKGVKIAIVAGVIVILLGICLSASFYTVDDKQQAVITTFGKVTDVTEAGIHFKLPFIQQAHIVDVNVLRKLEIGYRSDDNDATIVKTVENECKMITGDLNIVNVDFFVEYKVSDPVKYLFSAKNPEEILKNLVQSQIRNVVGSSGVDSVLTDGKVTIQQDIRDLTAKELEAYDIGLMLTDVKIQDAEMPTDEVNEAYKAVLSALQSKEATINLAQAYKESKLPEMEAEVKSITLNAEYDKQKRINEAKMQIAMFEAMYEQYKLNPEATRIRMYHEALQEFLPGTKVYIDTSDGSTQKLIPIESFTKEEENK